jgi:hypothetical protein
LRTHLLLLTLTPACSCVYICKFQFRPIHPPSRRLSKSTSTASYLGSSSELTFNVLSLKPLGSRGMDLTASAGSKLSACRLGSGTSLMRFSRSAMRASDSMRASAYSTHSTSHSYAWRYVGPTVMTPLGPTSSA